ncbi:MAG: membrane-bound O-acyltransferase family protein [Bacteroidetes bacterium HGW-Bacteroidetes-2]|jgi:D-alanyl-lipoteichoic acid acyltransferase DltB (MBOAT superfamily)|nr:MAG: membrane-bound O-acyltransferase family protein [Bacteroidetes bacterium HGW-Bacteroidetes-2]
MLFNSVAFFLFLPSVFLLYWFVFKKHLQAQNIFLLVASYVFYGWWDYRFLALIAASTLVDYGIGLALAKEEVQKKRNVLLLLSLGFNLGLLGFFKYFNFFIDSWVEAWGSVGVVMHSSSLNIILPVGISFYTFQTLSYSIDVFRKKLEPTKNLVNFAAFVAFFPQLVAGPIERASHLLPQFKEPRVFDYALAKSGLHLILWGLFKKVVVADNCAFFVNQIFEQPSGHTTAELWVGAILFGFQIYGDFSGYSDIAIGTGRLFGFRLMTNFAFPYFSRNIAEFWRRWHISLTTWFCDYLYIPLGGSRGSKGQQIRNVFVIFLVSGFWHGANWTFLIWGGIHAMLFLPLLLRHKNRSYLPHDTYHIKQLFSILLTFTFVTIAWVFFRADTVTIAIHYVMDLFSWHGMGLNFFYKNNKYGLLIATCVLSILVMLVFEFLAVRKNTVEVTLTKTTSIALILIILVLGAFKNPSDFIYFQF